MTWFERIIACHTAVTNAVSHAKRLKSDRYFVWMEDDRNDFEAGNLHAEKAVEGTTDLTLWKIRCREKVSNLTIIGWHCTARNKENAQYQVGRLRSGIYIVTIKPANRTVAMIDTQTLYWYAKTFISCSMQRGKRPLNSMQKRCRLILSKRTS